MVEKDISLLPHLNGFWIQVLLFAGRNALIGEELAVRIAYLSSYRKHFEPCLYQLLEGLYERYPKRDILEAVCKLIMKGSFRGMPPAWRRICGSPACLSIIWIRSI